MTSASDLDIDRTPAPKRTPYSPITAFGVIIRAVQYRNPFSLDAALATWPPDPPQPMADVGMLQTLTFPLAVWRAARATRVEVDGRYRSMKNPAPASIAGLYVLWCKDVINAMKSDEEALQSSFHVQNPPPLTLYESLEVIHPWWLKPTWKRRIPR